MSATPQLRKPKFISLQKNHLKFQENIKTTTPSMRLCALSASGKRDSKLVLARAVREWYLHLQPLVGENKGHGASPLLYNKTNNPSIRQGYLFN